MAKHKKKILYILDKPPHMGVYTQEMLDIIMTAAAFDQEVSLLLLDNGIFQIKTGQQLQTAGLRDTAAIFNALPLYDIKPIYIETESLSEHGLTLKNFANDVIEINRADISCLLKQFDLVLSG